MINFKYFTTTSQYTNNHSADDICFVADVNTIYTHNVAFNAEGTIPITGVTASGAIIANKNNRVVTITHATAGGSGTYGPQSNATLAHSGTFEIPYFTTDQYGHVSAAGTKTMTLPGSGNTDRYVNSAAFAPNANGVQMTLTRAGSDTESVIATIPMATTQAAGIMSSSDKANLNSLQSVLGNITPGDISSWETMAQGGLNGVTAAGSGPLSLTASLSNGSVTINGSIATGSISSGSTGLAVAGDVYSAINALPEPMIFKGSLGSGGSTASLPSAAASNSG